MPVYLRKSLILFKHLPSCYFPRTSFFLHRPFLRMASALPRLPIFEILSGHDPESTAVIDSRSRREFSYGELLQDVALEKERLLHIVGETPCHGQRIAFIVENSYEYVVSFLSIIGTRSIAIPLCPTFPVNELQYILNQSQTSILLASPLFHTKALKLIENCQGIKPRYIQLDKRLESSNFGKIILEESGGSEGGLILYTSGTTSRPKAVLIPQSAMIAQAKTLITAWKHSPKDHLLHVLPLHHIHGVVNGVITLLLAGSTIEFLFPFNAIAVWERIAAPFLPHTPIYKKISYLTAVPAIYGRLLDVFKQLPFQTQIAAKQGISPVNLRLNISGSAALSTSTKQAWKELSRGNVLLERYGMTEIGMALSCGLSYEDRVDSSVGWPLPGVEVRLVDTETNNIIGLGDELDKNGKERHGEIQVRGPNIFKEYFRNKQATITEHVESEDFRGNWFKTGDIAVRRIIDSSGHSDQEWARGHMYFILGRKSTDIIKSGGEKVSALEVERELELLPFISQAVVLGVPSGAWGQKIAAVVLIKPDMEERFGKWTTLQMRMALKDRLANYKIPRLMKVVTCMPRNAMGKINKKGLVAELFEDQISGDEKK